MTRSLKNLLLLGGILAPMAALGQAPAVAHFKAYAAKVPMHVVQIDPSRKDVFMGVITPASGVGGKESWSRLIDRSHAVAAVTGTYFDTNSGLPTGTIGFGGQALYQGAIGTAFSFTPSTGGAISWAKPWTTFDFKGADMFLRAGPRLLTAGKTTLWPRDEGFKDPAVFAKKRRTAIAITKAGKVLLVTVAKEVRLRELAAALKGIGAVDAMCLDGGSSAGMWYRGKSYLVPGRPLNNLIVVYETKKDYHRLIAMR